MRIEVSIAKTTALPNGALEALNNELSPYRRARFPAIDSQVSVRYASGNPALGVWRPEEDKDRISEILQGNMGKRGRLVLSTISPEAWRDPVTLGLLPHCAFFCRVAPAFFYPSSVQNSPDYSAQYRLKWPFYALILSKKAAKEENHACLSF